MQLKHSTVLTVTREDMRAILTEALCAYSALGGLEATNIVQLKGGEFEVYLNPKPEEE